MLCHLRNIYSFMLCIKISNKDIRQRLTRGKATCLDYAGCNFISIEFQYGRMGLEIYLRFSYHLDHEVEQSNLVLVIFLEIEKIYFFQVVK